MGDPHPQPAAEDPATMVLKPSLLFSLSFSLLTSGPLNGECSLRSWPGVVEGGLVVVGATNY